MGCGSSDQKVVNTPIRMNTVTGKLKVTISNALVTHDVSVFKMDPYLFVKLSNQEKQSKTIKNGGKEPVFNESFTYFINSCFKVHGRNLQMIMMDQKKIGSDAEIGFGIVDLDPIINFKKPKEEFRCFLSYQRKMAGFVNVIAEFTEEQAKMLSFRFEVASIRRKTSMGNMNCFVQVEIGEEILNTSKSKDTKQTPPTWDKDILTFNVPQSITECKITVYDDDAIVGSLEMELKELLKTTNEQLFNQQFDFEEKINAGSLKFQTLIGINPQFSEIKTVHKKPKEKKQEEKKQEQKKQEQKKQQQKKQEQKKQEQKKQQQKKQEQKKQQEKKSDQNAAQN